MDSLLHGKEEDMRNFAVMYIPPYAHPRIKRFQAKNFREALKTVPRVVAGEQNLTRVPVMIVDFRNDRAEMIASRGDGDMYVLDDVDYGEMTDFTRRVQ